MSSSKHPIPPDPAIIRTVDGRVDDDQRAALWADAEALTRIALLDHVFDTDGEGTISTLVDLPIAIVESGPYRVAFPVNHEHGQRMRDAYVRWFELSRADYDPELLRQIGPIWDIIVDSLGPSDQLRAWVVEHRRHGWSAEAQAESERLQRELHGS